MLFSGPPPEPVDAPAVVRALAGTDPATPVWVNEAGGTTWQLGAGGTRRFLKWAPAGSGLPVTREVERLRWAARFSPVPSVLGSGGGEDGDWLLTAGLPGRSAVDPRWLADPGPAVRAIGSGLRALHDALPVVDCPFDWTARTRLADVHRRAADLRPASWHREHAGLSVPEVLARLADVPDDDRLVVCHGDACAPNTLLGDDGVWTGHVDLGALGLADRWADLAVATWSTVWNHGPGWERTLLDAYGIDPGPGADGLVPAALGRRPVTRDP